MKFDMQNVITALLAGISLFLFRSFLTSFFQSKIDSLQTANAELRKKLEDHIVLCHKVPDSLVIEKIENICDKIDANYAYFKEMRDEFKQELDLQRTRYHNLNDHLIEVIGKLGGQLREQRKERKEPED